MKRINNLYQQICSIDNLLLADANARKGKGVKREIILHDLDKEKNILALRESLLTRSYKTSTYRTFLIFDRKEREVSQLPYYPDRIVHHAIVNVLEPVFMSLFTADTYSSIKGRGIHSAADKLKAAVKNTNETKYCLKLDIKKFYPSIDNVILKQLLRKKFKDQDLLWLLDEIIDSSAGLPIGNYLSQYFANFYLTYFDHWIKENKAVKYYFRYADDIVILHNDKAYLHGLLAQIRAYLQNNLNLTIKSNYQVFPVDARGVDFIGYCFYSTHTRLRKSIKQNFARMMAKNKNDQSIASYLGWAKHCNSRHLLKKLETNF